MARLAVLLLAVLLFSSCAHRSPIEVGIVFENSWTFGGEPMTVAEQSIVKSTALETLRRAFSGFDVRFADAHTANRLIRVEDTPYGTQPQFRAPGAAGMTYPASTVSSVRFDVLAFAERAVTACRDTHTCTKTRTELLEGLGRGIGATAAHELGHQAGIAFVRDSECDDCYDGKRSTSYAHFLATKHWSPEAATAMRHVLPPVSIAR